MIKPPVRACDKWGCGYFGASRGNRTHNGVDLACYKGSVVLALKAGLVTKIGYPYDPNDKKKGHLRYVEVLTGEGEHMRYFYICPSVRVNEMVDVNDEIGTAQGLLSIYPEITDHIHFEVKNANGDILDPMEYL